MTPALYWFLAGLVLVIVELMTGTFYLLIFGIACSAAALVAYAGGDFAPQAIVAAFTALVGLVIVKKRKRSLEGQGDAAAIDVGQIATFETWLNQEGRLARVRYRGAPWDADVAGATDLPAGASLFVTAVDGTRLKVSQHRP
ncbi:MAG: NfeD family protein [Betaproteobacteria bacterium]|nr:NfeD family protein [Betaproteobacteria bacterium]